MPAMLIIPEIASVGFNPPNQTRLMVEVMSIQDLTTRAPAEHFEKLQRADFFRLFGVLNGQTKPMVDFASFASQAQDWLLVRPGQVFRYDFSRPWSGWLLVFRPDSLSMGGGNHQTEEFDLLRCVEDLDSLHSLDNAQHDWMNRSLRQMQHDSQMTVDVTLRNEALRLQLASTLLRLSIWQPTNTSTNASSLGARTNFKRFRQKLEADLAKQHQVQHYANALGMSEKTLSRVCLTAVGVSAKACISQRLVLEAKRWLAHTTIAVQTIGRELGFDEPTNFVKFFRKETGMTPLTFRLENTKIGISSNAL
jgi:AraC-like DNA-binding protein